MTVPPRVAFFTDSFHEVNGVAHTSRQFHAFARRRQYPFLSIHAGPETKLSTESSVTTLELRRSQAAFSLEADSAPSFNPLLATTRKLISKALDDFRPALIPLTGPGDFGITAAIFARRRHIP